MKLQRSWRESDWSLTSHYLQCVTVHWLALATWPVGIDCESRTEDDKLHDLKTQDQLVHKPHSKILENSSISNWPAKTSCCMFSCSAIGQRALQTRFQGTPDHCPGGVDSRGHIADDMQARLYLHICIHMLINIRINICVYIYMYTRIYIHICKMHIRKCIHNHKHIYIHITCKFIYI